MRILISNLLNLNAQNISSEIYWILGLVYVGVWLVTLSSIFKTIDSFIGRLAWMVLVTLLPLAGITFYCFRCVLKADYSLVSQFLPKKDKPHAL